MHRTTERDDNANAAKVLTESTLACREADQLGKATLLTLPINANGSAAVDDLHSEGKINDFRQICEHPRPCIEQPLSTH